MAELSVGLGAVLFAPNSRFIVIDVLRGLQVQGEERACREAGDWNALSQ